MHDLPAILDFLAGPGAAAPDPVLLQLVSVRGSHYRRPGARMVATATGEAGAVSGGCLASELRERAAEAALSGRPRRVDYDLTAPEEVVWGFGLGCNGAVGLLLEPLADPRRRRLLRRLGAVAGAGGGGVLATLVGPAGRSGDDSPLGARLLLEPGGSRVSSGEGPEVETELAAAARSMAAAPAAGCRIVPSASGFEVLLEAVPPRNRLLVAGAGPDVPPVLAAARALGWETAVLAHGLRPPALRRLEASGVPVEADPRWGRGVHPGTALVLMTHDYLLDLELLVEALATPARYVGLLGPRERGATLLADLRRSGVQLPDLDRLHSPAGLDLGGDRPEEIALAIVAEARAVLAGRAGGSLRGRPGPIHPRCQMLEGPGSSSRPAWPLAGAAP